MPQQGLTNKTFPYSTTYTKNNDNYWFHKENLVIKINIDTVKSSKNPENYYELQSYSIDIAMSKTENGEESLDFCVLTGLEGIPY